MSVFTTSLMLKSLARQFDEMDYEQIKAFCTLILSDNFSGEELDIQSEYYAKKIYKSKDTELEGILIDLYKEAT